VCSFSPFIKSPQNSFMSVFGAMLLSHVVNLGFFVLFLESTFYIATVNITCTVH
jgi:hypothetical protein